jgi:hypothetical protein
MTDDSTPKPKDTRIVTLIGKNEDRFELPYYAAVESGLLRDIFSGNGGDDDGDE